MESSKRLVNLAYLGGTALAFVILTNLFDSLFSTFGFRDIHLIGAGFRASNALAIAVTVGLLVWAWRHARIRTLAQECADELTKVTWPTWEETKANTRVTFVVTVVVALILWMFDIVFGSLTNLILGGTA